MYARVLKIPGDKKIIDFNSECYTVCDVFQNNHVFKKSHENPVKSGFRFVAKFEKSGDSPMKQLLAPILALVSFALLASFPLAADSQKKIVIALSTDDIELAETDISSLAVGESKTIETDSGRIIDILRTKNGAEIYIDGELLEVNGDHEGLHDAHQITKHVEVICDDDENCEKDVFVINGEDADFSEMLNEEGNNVIFHKEIILSCEDKENASCGETKVWVEEGGDVDIEELHQLGAEDEGHKVIVIKKHVVKED